MDHQLDDRQKEFLILQYQAIRSEILALKERVIRVQTISISGIPLLVAAGENSKLDFVVIVSPIITAVVVLMISFEQNSIMRAGKYIRENIEPFLISQQPEKAKISIGWQPPEKTKIPVGWEDFLGQNGQKNRDAEKHFLNSVVLAFSLYYLGGSILAFSKIQSYNFPLSIPGYNMAIIAASIVLVIYLILFPFFIFLLDPALKFQLFFETSIFRILI